MILHSDDADAHRRRSFLVVSFASLLVHSCSPWDNRFLSYVIDTSMVCTETMTGLDTWLAWAYTELQCGRWFHHGPWSEELDDRKEKGGQLIANGYRGIVVCHRGDEKAIQKAFHMKVSWISEQVCWRCCASRLRRSRNLYTYFGPSAPHRSTICDIDTFITKFCRPNPWIRIPGFHPEQLQYDLLHVFDLTLVPDAAASVARFNICINDISCGLAFLNGAHHITSSHLRLLSS